MRYRLRGGMLDHCNQRCAISSARGGIGPPEIYGGSHGIVCARRVLDSCNQRVGARYRLRRGVRTAAIKARVRDIVCAGSAGPLQSKRACVISSARGVLDGCNQRGGAQYRLPGGVQDHCDQGAHARYRLCGGGGVLDRCNMLQSKGACAISFARGGCWTVAIKGGVRDIVCCARGVGSLQSKGDARYRLCKGGSFHTMANKAGVHDIVCAGGRCWTTAIQGGYAISSAP